MEQNNKQDERKTVIVCESTVDISDSQELKNRFLSVLAEKTRVEIDAREVTRIDTSALQLFYSFTQALKQSSIEFSWLGASEVFTNSAELLGIRDALGLAQA